ncbi:MAG: hypothetical protein HYY08_00145 [Firmicutes bacterium]|nr:hypothetical protein [Bacillota bacterium]
MKSKKDRSVRRGIFSRCLAPCLIGVAVLGQGFLGAWTFAETRIPVKVKADEYGRVELGAKIIVGKGNVEVSFDDTTVLADYVKLDLEKREVYLEGNVVLRRQKQELRGKAVLYNLDTREGEFVEAKGIFTGEAVKGNLFVSGHKLTSKDGAVVLDQGRITTCDQASPHFHLDAKQVEVYPGDKVVIRSVSFWDSGIPLFYWPYLAISLKSKESRFHLPQLGYNPSDGWFVKTTYSYFGSGSAYGYVDLDYFQRRGLGVGVRHVYQDDPGGTGTVSVYYVNNKMTGHGDFRAGVEHEFVLSPETTTDVSLFYSTFKEGQGAPETREISGAFAMTGRLPNIGTLDINATVRDLEGGNVQGREVAGALKFTRELGDGWRLGLSGNLSDTTLGTTAHSFGYLAQAVKMGESYALSVAAEKRLNSDSTGNATWTSVARLPEIALELRSPWLGGTKLPVVVSATAGKFAEERLGEPVVETLKKEMGVRLEPRSLRLSDGLDLSVAGSARLAVYDTGETQSVLAGELGATLQASKSTSLSLTYRNQEVSGTSPLVSDRQEPMEVLGAELRYGSANVRASLGTGYDLESARLQDLVGGIRADYGRNLKIDIQGRYDLYSQQPVVVAGRLELAPTDRWSLRFGAVHNFQANTWDRLDAQVETALGDNWRAGASAIWSGLQGKFVRGDLFATYGMEQCREITLRYDQTKGEVWVEYVIAAFPSAKVKLGTSQEAMMFDAQGWDQVLSDLTGAAGANGP